MSLLRNQYFEKLDAVIEKDIEIAYLEGKKDQLSYVISYLQIKRDALNFQRGGRPCVKPYLQGHNVKIELLDELILKLKRSAE
jgi:hypothetical protein